MTDHSSRGPIQYVIFAVNKDGKEFMRTKPQRTDNLTMTNALRKFVQSEVWFVGDIIKIEEYKETI